MLTPEELALARRLTEQEVRVKKLQKVRPLVLVDSELVLPKPDSEEEPTRRLARLFHYRYEDDTTILTLVDLARQSIVGLESIPHLPVPLAEEEFNAGRDLALAHAEVRRALGEHATTATPEALLLRAADEKDPIFGHRVLRFMFRLADGSYLSKPIALVDLTNRTVTIEVPPADPHDAP